MDNAVETTETGEYKLIIKDMFSRVISIVNDGEAWWTYPAPEGDEIGTLSGRAWCYGNDLLFMKRWSVRSADFGEVPAEYPTWDKTKWIASGNFDIFYDSKTGEKATPSERQAIIDSYQIDQ
jgi:hypothetical protein